MTSDEGVTYEADDRSPIPVSIGVGFQGVVLALAPTVLCAAFIAQTGYVADGYMVWAIFAALVINGIITAVQASRFGGSVMLITGATPNFIAVSVTALAEGGPALLASLIVVASLFQFALAVWLPLLRRIITPVVSGTIIMLIAVAVFPIAVESMGDVPAGAPRMTAPAAVLATLVVAIAMGLRATGKWRLWSPLIGILAGCAVTAAAGAYEIDGVSEAPWIGIPAPVLAGIDLTPGPAFWSLLPMFLVVSLAIAVKCTGSSIIMQRVSSNSRRVTDFRLVQGTVGANALGSALCGAAGVQPTVPYDGVSMSLANLTGVASRRTGYFAAAIMTALAFLPKLTALLLTIPGSVLGAYLLMMMGMLMVEGMRTVAQDGLDFRKVMVAGVALALGVGLESRPVFAGLVDGPWSSLLNSGITVGALAAIAMTSFLELTSPRRQRLRVDLAESALPRIDDFLHALASRARLERGVRRPASARGRGGSREPAPRQRGERPPPQPRRAAGDIRGGTGVSRRAE